MLTWLASPSNLKFLTVLLKFYGYYAELLELLYIHHFRIAYSNKKFFRAYETNQNTAWVIFTMWIKTFTLKLSFHLIALLTVEWVSRRNKKSLQTISSLKYLKSFNILLVAWKPFTLLKTKLILLAIVFNRIVFFLLLNDTIGISTLTFYCNLDLQFVNIKEIVILRDEMWTN